ncbi:MAG: membrane protein insertion efficiency factor YidD [Parcubacteria group bacterium]|nr:membrane protein insertion efficiency factor YidD [Parcubacteria group bacterium]
MKRLALALIKLYQKTLSPDHGLVQGFFPHGACKYRPTCSEYAYDAIQSFGILKGSAVGAKRIVRCHPWAQGGYDPVQ